VLVENFKVGDMARYGLDAATLRAHQPAPGLLLDHRLRPDRPLPRTRRLRLRHPGHGRPDERHRRTRRPPGGGPQKVGVAVADLFTGMYATVAILAALRHRDATGQGQVIDMALLDTQVAMLANLGANYLVTRASAAARRQRPPEHRALPGVRGGRRPPDPGRGQRRPVRASAPWPAAPNWPRRALREQRRPRAPPRHPGAAAGRACAARRADWLAALEAAKVPCGPINDLAEVFADPQVRRAA
jgi:crotonobetainyl-CoA:carnitine CoA-transferase CaiB-like acyl-CoA transferase